MQCVRLGIRIENDHGSRRIGRGLESIEVTEVESEVTKWRAKAEPSEMIRHVYVPFQQVKLDSRAWVEKRLDVEWTHNCLPAEICPLDLSWWNFNASRHVQDVKARSAAMLSTPDGIESVPAPSG
jgi:hypothetical protein